MTTEENKQQVKRFFKAINDQEWGILDDVISDANIYHGPFGDENRGPEFYKKTCQLMCVTFPDHHMTLEDMVAEGDKVVSRFSVSGTHTGSEYMGVDPTGKRFALTGMSMVRISNGKIVEEWENKDLLGMLRQLDVIPPFGPGK